MTCNPILFAERQRTFEINPTGVNKDFDRLSKIGRNQTPHGVEPCPRGSQRRLTKIGVAFIPVNLQHSRLQGLPVEVLVSACRNEKREQEEKRKK